MSYNTNIPNPTQSPSLFPGQATTNWTRLKTIINADHQFNDSVASTDGYHKVVRWVNQAGALGDNTPVSIAGVGQLYTKSVTQMVGVVPTTSEQICYQKGTGAVAASEASLSILPVRAYANFNGNAGIVNRESFNCVITRTGLGRYTLTFDVANQPPSDRYIAIGSAGRADAATTSMVFQHAPGVYATNHTTILFNFMITNGAQPVDGDVINVVIVGG